MHCLGPANTECLCTRLCAGRALIHWVALLRTAGTLRTGKAKAARHTALCANSRRIRSCRTDAAGVCRLVAATESLVAAALLGRHRAKGSPLANGAGLHCRAALVHAAGAWGACEAEGTGLRQHRVQHSRGRHTAELSDTQGIWHNAFGTTRQLSWASDTRFFVTGCIHNLLPLPTNASPCATSSTHLAVLHGASIREGADRTEAADALASAAAKARLCVRKQGHRTGTGC
jgi:hypothetical protein